jgi:hypothetical protein
VQRLHQSESLSIGVHAEENLKKDDNFRSTNQTVGQDLRLERSLDRDQTGRDRFDWQ